MLKLFPKVILADKQTELCLNGDELKGGTKVAFFLLFFCNVYIFAIHFSGVSILYDCSLLSDTKPCHILPLLFFNRSFISATFSSDKSPPPLNTPVDFCRYSSAVIFPVFFPATLPSVVMYLYTFSPPVISKNERSALWASFSSPLAFLPSSYGVYFMFRIIG